MLSTKYIHLTLNIKHLEEGWSTDGHYLLAPIQCGMHKNVEFWQYSSNLRKKRPDKTFIVGFDAQLVQNEFENMYPMDVKILE